MYYTSQMYKHASKRLVSAPQRLKCYKTFNGFRGSHSQRCSLIFASLATVIL